MNPSVFFPTHPIQYLCCNIEIGVSILCRWWDELMELYQPDHWSRVFTAQPPPAVRFAMSGSFQAFWLVTSNHIHAGAEHRNYNLTLTSVYSADQAHANAVCHHTSFQQPNLLLMWSRYRVPAMISLLTPPLDVHENLITHFPVNANRGRHDKRYTNLLRVMFAFCLSKKKNCLWDCRCNRTKLNKGSETVL